MSGTTDPLSSLVSSFSFSNVTTDMVTVGGAIAVMLVVWVGIRMIWKVGSKA